MLVSGLILVIMFVDTWQLMNNKKAKDLIDWAPEYHGKQGLKKAMKETIDWFKNPNNIKLYKSGLYNI